MDSQDVIVLDSSDEETENSHGKKVAQISKAKQSEHNNNGTSINKNTSDILAAPKRRSSKCLSLVRQVKRIKPTKLEDVDPNDARVPGNLENDVILLNEEPAVEPKSLSEESRVSKSSPDVKTEINTAFGNLLEACRIADPTSDMELLISKKLIRYYECVHPDFVNSKSFCKNVERVTNDIKQNPGLVYLKITGIIEELKVRRKSKSTVITNEDILTTGNEKRDKQIKKLNKALYILKKRIIKLDESEVDFDDEADSTFLRVERYKKRAMEIYEKICDLTGESKHAHRSLRKPISFQGTSYPEFNKAIQTFVNKTNTFPDFVDVLKCLEYCNRQYNFKLKSDEMKKIAEDAFIKIGKTLQNRRKTDLYETVTYFAGTDKDPAVEDTSLQTKLSENKKYHTRISTIIDKYALQQEKVTSDQEASSHEDQDYNIDGTSVLPTTSTNLPKKVTGQNICNNSSNLTTSNTTSTKLNGKCISASVIAVDKVVILDADDHSINSDVS